MAEAGRGILVFGDIIDDVVAVPSGPIRHDTDTVSDIRSSPGGSAANTAAWLGHLGATVQFIGAVGAADVARHSLDLQQHGVLPRLFAHPTLPTGAIVSIVEGESRSMLTSRGANADLDPALATDDLLAGAAIVHLTGHTLFTTADPAGLRELITRARSVGARVCIDPGSAAYIDTIGADRALELLDGADILVPNLDEGRALTGLDDPLEIAVSLARRFDLVALTLDSRGVLVARGGSQPSRIPAVPARIVDPTGAGDSFTAGFLNALLTTDDADAAAHAGATLAASAVAAFGARPAR